MQELVPFKYDAVALREACWIKGVPFFTRRAIGEWLEYSNPQKAIDNIVERNPHVRDPRWATTIRLSVADQYDTSTWKHSPPKLRGECPKGSRNNLNKVSSTIRTRQIETEVYNPMGFQLIVFESRQPKALRYKIAVAALVWAYTQGKLLPLQPAKQKLQYAGERIDELQDLPWGHKTLAMTALAEEIGKSKPTVYRWKKRKEDTGKLTYLYEQSTRNRNNTLYCATWRLVMEHIKAGKSNKEIAAEIGISIATVCRVRRIYSTKYDGLN